MEKNNTSASYLTNYYEGVATGSSLLYDNSGFMNYGYWTENTTNPTSACIELVNHLLAYFKDTSGTLLNVAGGNGSELEVISQKFTSKQITSINISQHQLNRAAQKVPGCEFIQMNATDMQFSDSAFANILCIEAAFHFDSRRKFLEESFRVLEPGGQIVLADILFKSNFILDKTLFPPTNQINSIAEYISLFEEIGFREVEVRDVTPETFKPFAKYMCRHMLKRYPMNVIKFVISRALNLSHYVYLSAVK